MPLRKISIALVVLGIAVVAAGSAAAEGIPVRGRVVADGRPVAGAQVRLTPTAGQWETGQEFLGRRALAEPVAEAATGADGRFVVHAPEAGFWRLQVDSRGSATIAEILFELVEETELDPFELVPEQALEVIVRDAQGRPLSARVSVCRTREDIPQDRRFFGRRWRAQAGRGTPWRRTATGEDGRVVVTVAPEDLLLVRAVAPGLVAGEATARGGESVRLVLARGVGRDVRVIGPRGEPLADVLVYDQRAELPLAATDADGRAVVTWEGSEPIELAFVGPDGRLGSGSVEPPGPDLAALETFVLAPPATVAGRVLDLETREPIAGAVVWSEDLSNQARTDARGEYELVRALERGRVEAFAVGYVAARDVYTEEGRAPTLALQPAFLLRGRVVDHDEAPLAGVEIQIQEADLPYRPSTRRSFKTSTRSRDDGRFQVTGLPTATVLRLTLSRSGLSPADERLEPSALRKEIRIVMERERRALGTVVDARRQPIAGARAALLPARDGQTRMWSQLPQGSWVETDDSGRFVIGELAAGAYDLMVGATGFAPVLLRGLEVPRDRDDVDLGVIELGPGADVVGRVRDRAGAPIAGARIRFAEGYDGGMPLPFVVNGSRDADLFTDAEGRFTIGSLRPGIPLALYVERDGFVAGEVLGVGVPAAEPVEVVLLPESWVTGTVRDTKGRAVGRARIVILEDREAGSGMHSGPRPPAGESDEDGRFEIRGLRPGPATVRARADGFVQVMLSGFQVPVAGELSGVEIVLEPAASVAGVVRDPQGEPVLGAMVRVSRSESGQTDHRAAMTDGDGRYTLDEVVAGLTTLAAVHPDFPLALRDLDVQPGANTADFVFSAGTSVAGRVVDELGAPVAGAEVRIGQPSVFGRRAATTGDDGHFVLSGLDRGDYSVWCTKEGFAAGRLERLAIRDQPITGIEIRLERGATVSGSITGVSSEELARLTVQAQGSSGGRVGVVSHDGTYRIEHVAAGPWVVDAVVEGTGRQVRERLEIEPGQLEATLDLDFAGGGFVLSGTAVHDDLPFQGARIEIGGVGENVELRSASLTDREGRFRLEGLHEGRYRLTLEDPVTGLHHSRAIEITGDLELRIELLTLPVSGTVRDALDHEAVEQAVVILTALSDHPFSSDQHSGMSDSRGYFSVGRVTAGTYQVQAYRSGYLPALTTVEVAGPMDDLEIELTRAEGVVFEVFRADGSAVQFVSVRAFGEPMNMATSQPTSEGGRVRLDDLPPGSYEISIDSPGCARVWIQATTPADLGRIVLPPGGSVDLRIPELEGDPTPVHLRLVGAGGQVFRFSGRPKPEPAWSEEAFGGGQTQVQGVPIGLWTVEVRADDGRSWSASVEVGEGVAVVVLE